MDTKNDPLQQQASALNEPGEAFKRLEHDYIHQHYKLQPGQKRPRAGFVSQRLFA